MGYGLPGKWETNSREMARKEGLGGVLFFRDAFPIFQLFFPCFLGEAGTSFSYLLLVWARGTRPLSIRWEEIGTDHRSKIIS